MSPIVGVLLFVACLFAAFVWILLYFFVIEGLLQKLVGAIFGVTIGGSKLKSYYGVGNRPKFYVSGWTTVGESSGCLSSTLVWVLGGLLRTVFIGLPVGGLLVLALILFFAVFGTKS